MQILYVLLWQRVTHRHIQSHQYKNTPHLILKGRGKKSAYSILTSPYPQHHLPHFCGRPTSAKIILQKILTYQSKKLASNINVANIQILLSFVEFNQHFYLIVLNYFILLQQCWNKFTQTLLTILKFQRNSSPTITTIKWYQDNLYFLYAHRIYDSYISNCLQKMKTQNSKASTCTSAATYLYRAITIYSSNV